jgi:hypothetical protein
MNLRMSLVCVVAFSFSTSFAKVTTCSIAGMESTIIGSLKAQIQKSLGVNAEMRPETLRLTDSMIAQYDSSGKETKQIAKEPVGITGYNFEFLNFLFQNSDRDSTDKTIGKLLTSSFIKYYDVSFKTKKGTSVEIVQVPLITPVEIQYYDSDGFADKKFCVGGFVSRTTSNTVGAKITEFFSDVRKLDTAEIFDGYSVINAETGNPLNAAPVKFDILSSEIMSNSGLN